MISFLGEETVYVINSIDGINYSKKSLSFLLRLG